MISSVILSHMLYIKEVVTIFCVFCWFSFRLKKINSEKSNANSQTQNGLYCVCGYLYFVSGLLSGLVDLFLYMLKETNRGKIVLLTYRHHMQSTMFVGLWEFCFSLICCIFLYKFIIFLSIF